MKWRDRVSLNLRLYLILVDDLLDLFYGLLVGRMVSVDSPRVPHLGVPVADQIHVEHGLPLGNRAIDLRVGMIDQGFDLLAHFLRNEQVVVEYGLEDGWLVEMCDEVVDMTGELAEPLHVLPRKKNVDQPVEVARIPGELLAPNAAHHLVVFRNNACAQRPNLQVE